MRLLIDTHLLLWASEDRARLPAKAQALMADPDNQLVFSAVNIWEVVVKHGLKRPDFDVDALVFRRQLLDAGYEEIPVTSLHALELAGLPLIHRDPFDRMLIAQVQCERMRLITHDAALGRYGEATGTDHILLRVQWPGLGQKMVVRTLERLGRVVEQL